MKNLLITLFIVLFANALQAQEKVAKRIVLVGDAGDAANARPVLNAIKQTIPLDEHTVVVYLGDNEYDVKKGSYPAIDAQAALVDNTGAKAYFVPGHSDWGYARGKGYKAIKAQNDYIKSLNKSNIFIYPKDGCAGVEKEKLGDDILLLFMDTQWWLHKYDKPGIESKCDNKTEMQVLDELKNELDDNKDKLVIFAGHHPFRSTGPHSVTFGFRQHIFPLTDVPGMRKFYLPLPIVGSLYPISRNFLYTRQDRIHPAYENMSSSIESVLQWYPFVVRAAAHDHSLQLTKSDEGNNYIVSGSGSQTSSARKGWDVKYKAEQQGFTVLEVSEDKKVKTVFYTVDNAGKAKRNYSRQLLDFSRRPIPAPDTATVDTDPSLDSVTVSINKEYEKASGFKRSMLGDNYRKEWAVPVKMKVLHLNTEKGGLKIEAAGGGKQSRSLHLVDAEGKKWTLRTVNKDPEKAIPENLRQTVANELVQDFMSAANPFAPLAVPGLAKPLDVVHTNPEMVFVPNDTALGYYRPVFANTVCLLEERYPSRYGEKSDNSWELLNNTIDKDDYTVDQSSFLTARMLDFLVADFDRHYDQWRWGINDTGKGKVYYAIPKDRDMSFYYSDGFLIKIASYNRAPFLKGFRYDIPHPRWMGFTARDIDRLYLNRLDANDWRNNLATIRQRLTDADIHTAVSSIPPEAYAIRGAETEAKLSSRRDRLEKAGMEYYKFLSKYVTVTGSNKNDYFKLTNVGDDLQLRVYDRNKLGDTTFLKYSRLFRSKETEEIWLYGFNGEDYFDIDESAKSKIKLRVIGGRGDDTFNLRGSVKNFVYDHKGNDNIFLSKSKTHRRFSRDADVHQFTYREQTYHSFTFPILTAGFNPDDRLLLGVGISRTTRGFRKYPYATFQKLSTLVSVFNQAYQLRYDGEFIGAVGGLDLVAFGQIKNPALDFFFGLGNETKRDEDKGRNYYQARYNYVQGDLMLRKRMAGNLISLSAGPEYYRYWNNAEDNKGKILQRPSDVLLDSGDVYSMKEYAGGKAVLRINNVDSRLLPTHGIDWNTEFTMLTGLNEKTQPLSRLRSDVAIYATLTNPGRLISVIRFGGGHIFSDDFEYFQAFRLGANNFLRGYRRDRFAGSSMAYGSLELRLKLFDVKSKVLPGDFGIIGFNDIGRVWLKGQKSDKWHNSYGGGLYYTPFNLVAVGATIGFSEEDMLFNASIGTNIRIFF
ncbi:MAG: metallophosphoesterase [Sphingobacteriales bacterium]|nr:MAG: metallophosphoesterase [Sphingobacteriales bacterium]